jgi:hypothetical protein
VQWEQAHPSSAQHDRVPDAQRLSRVVCRLAKVRGSGLGAEMWPEGIDGLITQQSAPVAQHQELHEFAGPAAGPRALVHRLTVDDDAEAAKQLDPNALGARVGDHPSSSERVLPTMGSRRSTAAIHFAKTPAPRSPSVSHAATYCLRLGPPACRASPTPRRHQAADVRPPRWQVARAADS